MFNKLVLSIAVLGSAIFILIVSLVPEQKEVLEPVGDSNIGLRPYRAFIELDQYLVEQNGEPNNPISNVRLEVFFPNQKPAEFPQGGQYWTIGNGKVQKVAHVFELPWKYIQNDGFKFTIQIMRKGTWYKPCQFEVQSLSQFDRSYLCYPDLQWQREKGIPEAMLDRQTLRVKVFSDLFLTAKELPTTPTVLH